MAEWQRVLLLAVLVCYATAQSPQSAEPATLKVSFVISLSVTSCSNSPAELEAINGIIANVVAAKASKPHRNYPVLVDVSTCASTSGGTATTTFTRSVRVSYRGVWKTRNFILESLRKQGPCRTFAGICRVMNGTNGNGCVLDALDPSNVCGKPQHGTCSPPCVNGRCVESKCICAAGYYGMQCQRFYGTDKLTFQIPRIFTGTSPPDHKHTAKLLVKAAKGWPLVCILRANLNHLNDTVYKPVSGDHMIHPVHACPHLLTPKSRAAFHTGAALASPGNVSQQLDLHDSIDVNTGKLKWVLGFSEEFSFLNTTSGPVATEPAPRDDAYDPDDTVTRYNDTAFFDQRLVALASSSAPVDAVTFSSFVKMDSYLRSPLRRRVSDDSDDQDQKMAALGSLTQALTQQFAAPYMKGLLLHLTRLDDDHAAVEADLSKQRGENCDMLAFQIYMARKLPDVKAADIYRMSDLQQCFCDASDNTMAGCLAFSDVIANDTANAYQPSSDAAGASRRTAAASASVQSAAVSLIKPIKGDEQQASGNRRRRILAAAGAASAAKVISPTQQQQAPPLEPSARAAPRTYTTVAAAITDRRTAAAAGVNIVSSAAAAGAWQRDALGPWSTLDATYVNALQLSTLAAANPFAPVMYDSSSRQLQQQLQGGVFCNFAGNEQMSGWRNFLTSNGINWVINGPSFSLQCCIPIPGTFDIFIGCFSFAVGDFNFQGFNGNFMTDSYSFSLENVLGMSDVYCKDQEDCTYTCGDKAQAANPLGPQGETWVCKLDKGAAVLDEMAFNFMAGFSFDFCVNFVKATGSSNAIKGILTMFGISPCFLGFSVATYPLRGWDYTLTLYAQILFIKITISWDLATDQDRDLCDHFCHCYPGNKLFGATPYCRMCTNNKKAVNTIDIGFRLLFFKFTLYNSVGNLPSPKQAACPAHLRKLAASSDMRRHDINVLNDLFNKLAKSSTNKLMFTDNQVASRTAAKTSSSKLGGILLSCSGCNATDSCIISRNANQTMTSCSTLNKEDVHVWLKLSVQDCLSGDCENCTRQTGDVASSCAKCNQCLSCAPGAVAGNSGMSSYCGNNATQKEFNDWHTVQDWIDDLVINGADAACPCKGAESCMNVFPTLLDGEGRELRNGICVNLTLPQTLDLLKDAHWPGTADGHTHDVGCSMGLTLALTLMNPPKHSWHGPSSFCAWWTGALAFVDGADDPYQPVGLPCGPREGALTSNASTEASLCPPVPGLVCAWDNTCSFAPKHKWSAFGCQQAYTSNAAACISTAFDNSTGLTMDQADCSIYHSNYQYYGDSLNGAPPPSWSTNSSCNGQAGLLRSAEFLEARNRDGHAWRMVLQGDGRLMVYWIHFHDFFDGIQKVPLLQEATALRSAVGRQVMLSFPALSTSYWKSNGYFRAGPSPYILQLTHDGLFMKSANAGPQSPAIWSLTWFSIGAGSFDRAYPVSIRGTNMTAYTGWFSVCGLPAVHTACALDGQAAVTGQPMCSSLEKCHPLVKLWGP